MQLSAEQERALSAIKRWDSLKSSKPFILAGYAGTGKTTLLQYFINLQTSFVKCLAPTGKAASVLQKKLTNATVSTIHRAIYKPVSPSTIALDTLEFQYEANPTEELRLAIAEEKARLAGEDVRFNLKTERTITNGQLVVVDEASMVTPKMQRDLELTGARVLYVGDPGQLPPVQGESFFRSRPDAMLEEVQRQALDSPIIRASMDIRAGREPDVSRDGPFRCVSKQEVSPEEWLTFDQVITGKNEIRRRINAFFRRKKGFDKWFPRKGDKLICLKNDYQTGLVHGHMGQAVSDINFNREYNELMGDVICDGVSYSGLQFYRYPFIAHYDPKAAEEPVHCRIGMAEFDFGYAITVHKAQGSEWNRVLLADDVMMAGNREFRRRWLYTAVTRAKEELLWVY